jgi:hypothetical protein
MGIRNGKTRVIAIFAGMWTVSALIDRAIFGPSSAPVIYVISGLGLCVCIFMVFHPSWVSGLGENISNIWDNWFP